MSDRAPLMPSTANEKLTWFDRFATMVSSWVSRAWFFATCVLVVLLWLPSYFLVGSLDTYQLLINTFTTIVTYLLVALIQNTQSRDNKAIHRKLNAIADALADLMESQRGDDPTLCHDVSELRRAVGLEQREGS